MNNLGSFLDKFKKIMGTSKFQKDAVLSVINSVAHISLKDTDIEIKNYTVYIKASPAVRAEIYMRKQKILKELSSALGAQAPKDIR